MISAGKSGPALMTYRSHCLQWLCLLALLLLSGCERGRELVRLSGSCMGTTWHVSYLALPGVTASPTEVEAGIARLLEQVEQSMSTYRDDSELSQFNRAPAGNWVAVSLGFASVLEAALQVGAASDGAYDVTVGPLVDIWGFGAAGGGRFPAQVPAAEDIAALRDRIGQRHLELDLAGGRARKNAMLSLDFSSIAKGYGVDVVADWLATREIGNYLVEVGGEMRLAGHSARGDRWRVAIEEPATAGGGVAEALALNNGAVATSGDYRNFFELEGRRFSHSIDPRTGYPVTHDLVSVTVVHDSAMLADAWATALTVLGAEAALRVADAQGLAVYFIRRAGTGFSSRYTTALAPYLAARQP
jgi:thiamine biosynthesis lipoprotein